MHSKSDDKEIKINDKADKVFKSLLNRYQNNLETSMRGSDFIFDCVHLLYYKLQKINLNRGSYLDSPHWITSKKSTINPINKKDNKDFQYAVTIKLREQQKIKLS